MLVAVGCGPAALDTASLGPGEAIVTRVVDGDTVEVHIGGRTEPVRLIGIDTPEVAHPPEPAECYGPEAAAFVAALLPPGTRVSLSRDIEARDAYDRLLAYVVRSEDELSVNEALLQQGYAAVLSIAPNNTFASEFARIEDEARRDERGLWSEC